MISGAHLTWPIITVQTFDVRSLPLVPRSDVDLWRQYPKSSPVHKPPRLELKLVSAKRLKIVQASKNPSSLCTPQSSSGSSFTCHSRGSSARSLLKLTLPLPSCIPTAGPSSGPFPSFATISDTPSVDFFLYFFEAKNPDKRLWLSFNGVAGRVLLTLF